MKFIQRLSFYLGGVSIGLIFLVFFLSGKRTQCTWFPEARVLNDFKRKSIYFSPEIRTMLKEKELDTLSVQLILAYGDVNFSKSITDTIPCKFYHVSGKEELENMSLWVKNCSKTLTVEKVIYNDND